MATPEKPSAARRLFKTVGQVLASAIGAAILVSNLWHLYTLPAQPPGTHGTPSPRSST